MKNEDELVLSTSFRPSSHTFKRQVHKVSMKSLGLHYETIKLINTYSFKYTVY